MTHEFDFGTRAPTWEQRARRNRWSASVLASAPIARRAGNVIAVDFSQVAERGALGMFPDDDDFFPF